jgi:DNA replication protein DnaC
MERIFADDMMTVAAVDRLVHHALIVEIQTDSYRKRAAAKRSTEANTSNRAEARLRS